MGPAILRPTKTRMTPRPHVRKRERCITLARRKKRVRASAIVEEHAAGGPTRRARGEEGGCLFQGWSGFQNWTHFPWAEETESWAKKGTK